MSGGVLLARFACGSDECLVRLRNAVGTAGSVRTYRALEGDEVCGYVDGGEGAHDDVVASAVRCATPDVTVIALLPLAAIAGTSSGEAAPYHYMVETDVAPEHEADFNAWYDREHLPGLAAVPGCARALRFRAVGSHRRYYACYDLTRPETLGSGPWLAVRHSAWSDRVRPTFRNTKRTMFRRVP